MKTIFFSAVAIALFFGLYAATLRRSNLFRLRRYYLIGTLLVAMIIPFVSIETEAPQVARVNAYVHQIPMFEEVSVPQIETQEETSEPVQVVTPSEPVAVAASWTWKDVLLTVYLIGCAVSFIFLLLKLIKTASYYRRARLSETLSTWEMRVRVLAEPDGNIPFSFLRSVFVNPEVFTDSELQQVLAHERAHIRQHHTADLLFLEAVKVLQWFNPILYFCMKELKSVHEYLADEEVLAQGAAKHDYLELLYKQLCMGKFVPVGNSFRHFLTKNRIQMMNQKEKRRMSAWWLIALIPIVAGLLLVNCHSKTDMLSEEVAINEPVCKNPDVMPEFPGGIQQYLDNLFDSMQFPEIAKQHRFLGTYLVRFIVEKDGKIHLTEIDTTLISSLDVEGDGNQKTSSNKEQDVKGKIVVNSNDYKDLASEIDSANEEEINRAFRNAPACKPAMKDGQPVRCELRLPVFFVFEMLAPLGESITPENTLPRIAHYTIDTIPTDKLVIEY